MCSRTFGCWRWCSSKFLKCNLTRTREPRNHHELLLVAMSCIPPCTLSSRPWSPTFQHAPLENGHEIFDRPWCPEENESKLYPFFKTILCNLALKTPKGIRSCWRNFQNLQDFFKFCNWVGSKSIHPFIQPSNHPSNLLSNPPQYMWPSGRLIRLHSSKWCLTYNEAEQGWNMQAGKAYLPFRMNVLLGFENLLHVQSAPFWRNETDPLGFLHK